MKKYNCILIFLIFCTSAFSQENYHSWKGINEFSLSFTNDLRFLNKYRNPGLDLGVKKIIQRPNKRTKFILGVEFFYSNSYLIILSTNFDQGYKTYSYLKIHNFGLSTSFAFRFQKSKHKRFYKELGVFIDVSPSRYIKGYEWLDDYEEQTQVQGFVKPRYFSFGINTGLGWTFRTKNYEFDIKPDLKLNFLPYIFNHYKNRFDNAVNARIVFNFRKLEK